MTIHQNCYSLNTNKVGVMARLGSGCSTGRKGAPVHMGYAHAFEALCMRAMLMHLKLP